MKNLSNINANELYYELHDSQSAGKVPDSIAEELNYTNGVPNNDVKVPDIVSKMPNNYQVMSDSEAKVPNNSKTMPDNSPEILRNTVKISESMKSMPENAQEKQIYKYVQENGSITTAEAMELLGVKQRRARIVLSNMVKSGYLKKKGAARSTIYIIE